MKVLALTFVLAVSITASAQKNPIKFGDVPPADMQMSVYDPDTSAAAVILADFGESTINYTQTSGFQITFERLIRIKILTQEGLDWANFEIPLYNDAGNSEKASSIRGATYNLVNGKIVTTKLSSDGRFKEKRDDNLDVIKITLPSAQKGSVIELTYTVVSDFLMNFQDWNFQTTIPTRLSEYRANIPEYFRYDQYMQGYVGMAINDKKFSPRTITLNSFDHSGNKSTMETSQVRYTETNFRWVAQAVPAFKSEPFITTYKDFISKINFELASIQMPNEPIRNMLGSWSEINKKYYEVLGKEINANGFLKGTVETIIAGMVSPEEKIGSIVNYVKQNVEWDGVKLKFPEKSLKKVLDEKKGNSTEVNLTMGSMLEKAGFQVSPVLVSTRDHGMLREGSPVSSQFNYVICMVSYDGKYMLLDATERFLPVFMIPQRCLNGKGLVLGKETFDWVDLESKTKTRSSVSAELTLSEGSLVGKLKLDQNGYAAMKKRQDYFSKGEADYMKEFLGSRAWECNKSEFQNAKELASNFVELHELTISESIVAAGDVIYLDPFILNDMKTNPFKTETREYPVNFGSPLEFVFSYKLTVPDNYSIDELPKSKVLALPENSGRFIFNSIANGNVINITSIFSINKGMFSQLEYPALREFYNQVVAKQAEQIVLKKK
jgi:hypothetical protein